MTQQHIRPSYGTRESKGEFVGVGPAVLSAVVRLKQLAAERHRKISVFVLEKRSEQGAHTLACPVKGPCAPTELLPT